MLSSIAAITIPLLLLMFITFFIFEHNRKKKLAEQKKALGDLVNDLKHSYKLDVTRLSEAVELSTSHRDKLYMLANNFFVYQAINEENVSLFDITLKKLSFSYNRLLEFIELNDDISLVTERLDLFIENLPNQSRGFNANFYLHNLNPINQLLELPEVEEAEETAEGEEIIETDEANIVSV